VTGDPSAIVRGDLVLQDSGNDVVNVVAGTGVIDASQSTGTDTFNLNSAISGETVKLGAGPHSAIFDSTGNDMLFGGSGPDQEIVENEGGGTLTAGTGPNQLLVEQHGNNNFNLGNGPNEILELNGGGDNAINVAAAGGKITINGLVTQDTLHFGDSFANAKLTATVQDSRNATPGTETVHFTDTGQTVTLHGLVGVTFGTDSTVHYL
jgi:hypothetical protein